MPLEGEQITYGWALALCYYAGFRGKDLNHAVALMTAESLRYTKAYHQNTDEFGTVTSTDWGLFQINDRFHPDFEMPTGFNPIYNAKYAHKMFKASQGFSPWAAFGGDRYTADLKYVWAARLLGRWKNKVPMVEKRFA